MRAFPIAIACGLMMAASSPALGQVSKPAALGVQLDDMAGDGKILIHKVMPGLTAQAIGLKEGDELIEINGTKPADADAVVAYVGTLRAGDPVTFVVLRGGTRLQLSGTAAARPDNMVTGRLREGAPPAGTSN